MLTYNLTESQGPLYKALYNHILTDIQNGKLKAGEKLPSKRSLAQNLGISTISIENAYDQLISEGYIYTLPKKGYFVSQLDGLEIFKEKDNPKLQVNIEEKEKSLANDYYDFSSNRTEKANFPFSIWAKLLRETISHKEKELMELSPSGGIKELRQAIANHLESFRGMKVNPDQIIVGAGTEYLYGLLIKLLGNDKIYCIENPGYKKLLQIYQSNKAVCLPVDMDDKGLSVEELRKCGGQIAHISPTHHFPTGICMLASRRYEMLAWANESEDRFIIEDDYDSEFRQKGKPIPSLFSLDVFGKVIYMNTFSKSLSSTIRISYMILPEKLANLFYQKLSFFSCTVSNFEQYTLAAFISQGYFEKHINRMRLHYGRKRARVMEVIRGIFGEDECKVIENDSGLHFILEFKSQKSDRDFKAELEKEKIHIASISDFEMKNLKEEQHKFILNYSNIDMEGLKTALEKLRKLL